MTNKDILKAIQAIDKRLAVIEDYLEIETLNSNIIEPNTQFQEEIEPKAIDFEVKWFKNGIV